MHMCRSVECEEKGKPQNPKNETETKNEGSNLVEPSVFAGRKMLTHEGIRLAQKIPHSRVLVRYQVPVLSLTNGRAPDLFRTAGLIFLPLFLSRLLFAYTTESCSFGHAPLSLWKYNERRELCFQKYLQ